MIMKIEFTLKAPLTHGAFGDENLGNYSAFRRLPIIVDGNIKKIPVVSGNSVRGAMRRCIMRELYDHAALDFNQEFIETFGLTKAKRAWDRMYAVLFGGGTFDNVEVNIQTEQLRELRKTFPYLSLFGSAMYNIILPGMLNVGFAVPCCNETIASRLCDDTGDCDVRFGELLTEVGLTRHIDRENADPENTGIKPMPYQVEALIPGTKMQFEVSFQPMATDIEIDCARHAIGLLGSLGGKVASGFGQIEINAHPTETGEYIEWLQKDSIKGDLYKLAEMLL